MNIVIIGSGNVATVLGRKILAAGHDITQVVGRNMESATELATLLKASVAIHQSEVNQNADVYIIAVSDSSIAQIASTLKISNKIVVHTAAAVSKNVLSGCSDNYGVLYPLQTLKKELETLPPIPILIDANNLQTKNGLMEFAESWAKTVDVANDTERRKLHIAAVFVNNFTNHLFTLGEQYCKKEDVEFNILLPLIEETIRRIGVASPSAVQTGPAIRNDIDTLAQHEQLLSAHPKLKEMYKFMTHSIVAFYGTNTGIHHK